MAQANSLKLYSELVASLENWSSQINEMCLSLGYFTMKPSDLKPYFKRLTAANAEKMVPKSIDPKRMKMYVQNTFFSFQGKVNIMYSITFTIVCFYLAHWSL